MVASSTGAMHYRQVWQRGGNEYRDGYRTDIEIQIEAS